ncbi:MAG: hypothetical protein H6753_00800 [Candidatus Omnitrophica bacterium]|nr:hypothetical protein [Candidatus Omnitrophota bacterium]
MILLRGTQKFLLFSGIKPQSLSLNTDSPSVSEWFVNLFYHEHKKQLLFTHRSTLFSFLVAGVKKKDLKNLRELFYKGLSRAMFHTHCPSEMMQKVLQGCDEIVVDKANDRSVLASMNQMVLNSRWWLSKAKKDEDPAAVVAAQLNGMPMGALKYGFPIETFSALYGYKVPPDLRNILWGIPKEEDLKTYLRRELGEAASELADASPARIAQELIYEAWERADSDERVGLAQKALNLDPNCTDAYVVLGDSAEYLDEAATYFLQGVRVGKEALGQKFFIENAGQFWALLESRPYMRALAGLQEILWELGKHAEAIEVCRDMLCLNENDNQGMRYVLAGYLAKRSKFAELEQFMEDGPYANDCSAPWCYTRALVWFIKEGDSLQSREMMARAFKTNKFIPNYLVKGFRLKAIPDYLSMGGEDEARYYAHEMATVWRRVKGVLDWMMANHHN